MSPVELYDVTRGIWKVGVKREQVELAFAVYEGIVQEVYRIASWHPAGTTFSTRVETHPDPERWEFVGRVAEETVRKKHLNKSVAGYFTWKSQNPVRYVNC